MRTEQAAPAGVAARYGDVERGAARSPRGTPPTWLVAGLGAGYVVALLGLAFLPGSTLLDRLRTLDGGICAQNPTHSFFPAGQQLPLCSRNTGIYLGFACTILLLAGLGRLRAARLPGGAVAFALGLAVLLMAEDGFNSLFRDLGLPHFYQPHNLLRLASGLAAGAAMAAFIVPVASGLIWREQGERASFGSLRELALLLPIFGVLFLAVGSQAPFLLYPIALLSSAGLVVALSLVNVVLALGLSNRVGQFAGWRQFFPVYTIAVALAAVELLALFVLKTHLLEALTP